eukprot:8475142-Alexandrium_andersonii.AAC.1
MRVSVPVARRLPQSPPRRRHRQRRARRSPAERPMGCPRPGTGRRAQRARACGVWPGEKSA